MFIGHLPGLSSLSYWMETTPLALVLCRRGSRVTHARGDTYWKLALCIFPWNKAPLQAGHRGQAPQKETSHVLAVTPHSPPPSAPGNPIYFLSLWICLFWAFNTNEIIQYVLLCLASFIRHNVCKSHPGCSRIVFHCTGICKHQTLFMHSSVDGHLGCSHFLATLVIMLL